VPSATAACRSTIRGGNDAHVHADGPAPTDPLEFALLQHAQQHDLGFRGQLADLVEKRVPPSASSKRP